MGIFLSISPVAQESVPVSMWKRLCGMYGGCKGIIFIAKSLPSDIQFLPQRSLDVLNFFAVGERSRKIVTAVGILKSFGGDLLILL